MFNVCKKCHDRVAGDRSIQPPAMRTFDNTCHVCKAPYVMVYHMAWGNWYKKYLSEESHENL